MLYIKKILKKGNLCRFLQRSIYQKDLRNNERTHLFKKKNTMASFDADIFLKVMEKRIAIISTCTVFFAE